MRIPILTDEPEKQGGWHGNQLKQAFALRGVEVVFVSLQDCVIDLASGLFGEKPSIKIPHFDTLPRAAFVRSIAGGTLQQITTRLNVLHILKMLGVRVYNDGRAIERTVDKAMTSFLLHQAGIATPATWVCESRLQAENIRQVAAQNNQRLVLKPLFGSQGLGVRKLPANAPLPVPMQQFVDGVYYFQQLIETTPSAHDYRVFVIDGKVVASMRRTGSSWVNNIAAGGICEGIQASEIMEKLALQAALALDIDYCGVDIIQAGTEAENDGEYYVLEVNSIPAWKGLQSVTEVNIAQLLADDLLGKI